MAKVDLELEEAEDGYSPANSLVELSLPKSGAGAIQVGDIEVSLKTEDGVDSPSRRFGEDLYLPEVAIDTDMLLSPITGGVEISVLVLSQKSPEQLNFSLGLPPGAELRASRDGGVEVFSQEKKESLATISTPFAIDAQGTPVPARLAVEQGEVIIEFPHRGLDVAYPIFVDPEIEENWSGFADISKLNYWTWQYSGVGVEDYIGWRSCIVPGSCWGNGLYVRSRSNFSYPGGSFGRWWFVPQGSTTYMRRVVLGPMNYNANGCTANEPHPYVGVWNDYSGWKVLSNAYPSGWGTWIDTGGQDLGAGTRTAFVGIEASGSVNLKCGHDYRLGGAVLFLNDPENPTIGTVSGYPTGWIKDNSPFTLNVPISDPGLGVKSAKVSPTDSPPPPPQELSCPATYASPCPAGHNFQFPMSADSLFEGEKEVRVSAFDALGRSSTSSFMLKVDSKPPDVALGNQLAKATDEVEGDAKDGTGFDPLGLPVYNLEIAATDGSNQSASTRRSGVKSIEVFLDKKGTPEKTWTQSPCSNSCGMTQTYTLKLNELTALAHHTLKVVIKDHAGNIPREREIEFEYVPATGMKEEYVLHYFPLPNGQGEEDSEENPIRPELAVNVMNGNLVYRQLDVNVPGPGADLEVERYYNSLLPESQNTEWGDGWTLAQTPTIEADEPGVPGPITEATMVEESGAVESSIKMPTAVGEERFDQNLQALVTKETNGYEITDESGDADGTLAINNEGDASQLHPSAYTTVDYEYAGGELSEIAIDDPASVSGTPTEVLERETLEDITPSFKSAFGSQGTGDGQFKVLTDVATDPTDGTIWATDDDNNRIQHFSVAGAYLGKFATCLDPGAVELDPAGDIYIVCSGSGSVRKYSDQGTLLKTLATFGSGNAQVRFPLDLAFDPEGKLWVADSENDRLVQFDSAGNFLKAVPLGAWSRPWGIAVDADGNIWAAEASSHRVSVFSPSGALIQRIGSQGSGYGQFERPSDVEIDQHGYVWVPDGGNNRVQIFTPQGEYISQFGKTGSGDGQLSTYWWMRISVGPQGDVFVADEGNSRVTRWAEPNHFASFKSAFGSQGTGDGQFKVLTDVATDPTDGTIWATDDDNNRIQHFSVAGAYLGKFATCLDPGAVELDPAGDIYIVCSGSGSVRKYSDQGTLLKTLATFGSGNAQVRFPLDLAFDPEGKLWVADSENDRLVQFDSAGNFLKAVPLGAWSRPWGIAVDADGNIWAAEASSHRVSVFSPSGALIQRIGSQGSGYGQFERPSDVEIDQHGYVWVPDGGNNRVQIFTPQGEYISQFGKTGSGDGQLSTYWWMRISVGPQGDVFVADEGNSRVTRWKSPNTLALKFRPKLQDDPSVIVDTTGDLVSSIEGDEAGELSYEHEGDLLTSVAGPEEDTEYEYDGSERMKKITLDNGTYAEITYEPTYGRVATVKVVLEGGSPQTTYFNYKDQPQRQTTVTAPGVPIVTYDFADDGSMLKSYHPESPPTLDDVGGTLHAEGNRETATPIAPGLYNLTVQADSPHGVASIEIVANNNQLVSEKTCPQIPGPPVECEKLSDEWVMETGSWAPGILYLEVIATHANGKSTAERFWVNIPYTPPPDPEADEPPKFADVLKFREDYGLDLDIEGNEEAINDRVYNLLGDWDNPNTPPGVVARATRARWGVPLRSVDAAELEHRDRYIAQAANVIPKWSTEHGGGYAGYYVNHKAGGILHVGFTANQAALIAQLKAIPGLIAPNRIAPFPYQPNQALANLETLLGTASDASISPSAPPGIVSISIDYSSNRVRLGTTEVAATQAFALSAFGAGAPVTVVAEVPAEEFAGRYQAGVPFLAATYLRNVETQCMAGFGAWSKVGTKDNGDPLRRRYVLTAGHCFPKTENAASIVSRPRFSGDEGIEIGKVERQGFLANPNIRDTDAEAIWLSETNLIPSWIYECCGGRAARKVTGVAFPKLGDTVCQSSQFEKRVVCGPVTNLSDDDRLYIPRTKKYSGKHWMIRAMVGGGPGDSGGPVWLRDTGEAIGLIAGGGEKGLAITPFLRPPAAPSGHIAGIYSDPYLSPASRPLHVQVAK